MYLCNSLNVTRIEKFILAQLKVGNFSLTIHARERMNERFISELDIVEIAKTLRSIRRQKTNDTYLLSGLSTWKEKLKVSVAVRKEVIVVTVFYEDSL
mgnify:CR=1 FL=1